MLFEHSKTITAERRKGGGGGGGYSSEGILGN